MGRRGPPRARAVRARRCFARGRRGGDALGGPQTAHQDSLHYAACRAEVDHESSAVSRTDGRRVAGPGEGSFGATLRAAAPKGDGTAREVLSHPVGPQGHGAGAHRAPREARLTDIPFKARVEVERMAETETDQQTPGGAETPSAARRQGRQQV